MPEGLEAYENAGIARARGAQVRDLSDSTIVAAAQLLIAQIVFGDHGELEAGNSPEGIGNDRRADPAARMLLDLDAAGVWTDPAQRALTLSVAAAGFALDANFPSAALAVRLAVGCGQLAGPDLAALAAIAPSEASRICELTEGIANTFARDVAMWAHVSAEEGVSPLLVASLRQLLASTEGTKSAMLLGLASRALHRSDALRARRVLGHLQDRTGAAFLGRVVSSGKAILMPPQAEVMGSVHFADLEKHALVTLPTSGGKTLVGITALAVGVAAPDEIGVFIAPYVAIARNVHEQCIELLSPAWRVSYGYASASDFAGSQSGGKGTVLVCTPEHLDALLRRRPELRTRITTVVVDEAHILADGVRGLALDGLLSRLMLSRKRRARVRLVLLSAVLDDASRLRAWLGDNLWQTVSRWRPSARRLAFWQTNAEIDWVRVRAPVGETARVESVLKTRLSPVRHLREFGDSFATRRTWQPAVLANVALLAEEQIARGRQPVLVVSARKADARACALAVADRIEPEDTLAPKSLAVKQLIDTRYPHLTRLGSLLHHRVAWHHGAVPHDVRALLEDAMRAQELLCICATTTLAEGVDLPVRSTILADWLFYQGKKEAEPARPSLLRNVVGRCGRAGVAFEGETIVVENPLGPPRFTSPEIRRDLLRTMVASPVTLDSPIPDDLDAKERESYSGTLAGQLLATISEHPSEENVDTVLAGRLFSLTGETGSGASVALWKEARALVLDGDEPLATHASPLRLSALGNAVRRSLTSPLFGRAVLSALRTPEPFPDEVPRVALRLLLAVRDTAEARDAGFSEIFKPRYRKTLVRPSDVGELLAKWIDGAEMIDLFAGLAMIARSSNRGSFDGWRSGASDDVYWGEHYDKFVELAHQSFGGLAVSAALCAAELPLDQMTDSAANFSWRSLATALSRPQGRLHDIVSGG